MFRLLNIFKKRTVYPKKITPEYTGHSLFVYEEINKVKEGLAKKEQSIIPELIKQTSHFLVWSIAFKHKEAQFMSYSFPNVISDDKFIVYVDLEVFYLLILIEMLKKPDSYNLDSIFCLRDEMSKDFKYKEFETSFEKPIPLSYIRFSDLGLSIIDGITRLKWLIVNHAIAIPVLVEGSHGAKLLNDLAGLTDRPLTLSSFIVDK